MNQVIGGWVVNGIYQFETGAPIVFTKDIPLQPGMTVEDIKSRPRNTSPTTPALVNAKGVFVTGNQTSCTASGGQPCDGSAFFNGQYPSYHYRTLPTTIGSVRADGSSFELWDVGPADRVRAKPLRYQLSTEPKRPLTLSGHFQLWLEMSSVPLPRRSMGTGRRRTERSDGLRGRRIARHSIQSSKISLPGSSGTFITGPALTDSDS